MPISARNLVEAIDQAHAALRLAANRREDDDKKLAALMDAAGALCEQFQEAKNDDTYWEALKGGEYPKDAAGLSAWATDLYANKDGRRDDLVKLYRIIGYKPPEHAEEAVLGLVAGIHAGTLVAGNDADQADDQRVAAARYAFTRFASRFCAAESALKKSIAATALGYGKKGVIAATTVVVKKGAAIAFGLAAGLFLPPMLDRLPPEAQAIVCQYPDLVSKVVKPAVVTSLCLPPGELSTPELERAHLDAELRDEIDRLEHDKEALVHQRAKVKGASEALKQADQAIASSDAILDALRKHRGNKPNSPS